MPELFAPHPPQRRGADDLVADPFHCLFFKVGVGKTSTTLLALTELQQTLEIRRALIVAPLRVCYSVWAQEAAKWRQFRHLRVHNLHERFNLDADADIYLINPAGLPKLFGHPTEDHKQWISGPWSVWHNRPEMLVIDELTQFKNARSGRSRTLKRYLGDFTRRVGLTGTPAPNGIQDLFGQMLMIDRGEALGDKITHFRKKWCSSVSVGAKGRKFEKHIPKDGSFEEIQKLIKPRVTVLEAGDWIKLPDTVQVDVPVVLDKKTLDLYRKAVKEAFAVLDCGTPFDASMKATKLKQLANGLVYTGDPLSITKEVVRVHMKKVEALEELIDELNQPVLVAYENTCDGEYLAKKFKAPIVNGTTSGKESDKIFAKWNTGKIPILLIQPAAAQYGLNLQLGGSAAIWYSIPWCMLTYSQFNGRLARQGQAAESVFIYHLVAKGTVDERIVCVLEDKEATQEMLLEALKKEIKS